MIVSKVMITPAKAAEILSNNPANRPLNERHVKILANEMSRGRWKFNGATICLNGYTLIDGQHRLAACISASTSFETLVINGIDSDAFDTIDAGRRRSMSDVLSIQGEKNTVLLAATLGFVTRYITSSMTYRRTFTSTTLEETLKQYPGVRDSVHFTMKFQLKGLLPKSMFAGCHYLFSQKDNDLADSFLMSLAKGHNLVADSALCLLRERLIQNSLSNAKMMQSHMAALMIKAWNSTRAGKPMKVLKWRITGPKPEAFPMVE